MTQSHAPSAPRNKGCLSGEQQCAPRSSQERSTKPSSDPTTLHPSARLVVKCLGIVNMHLNLTLGMGTQNGKTALSSRCSSSENIPHSRIQAAHQLFVCLIDSRRRGSKFAQSGTRADTKPGDGFVSLPLCRSTLVKKAPWFVPTRQSQVFARESCCTFLCRPALVSLSENSPAP